MKEEKNTILKLPLRKQFAKEIISGKKVREYRQFNDHWASRICLFEDDTDKDLATGIKFFETAHFYPYNNKWHLNTEIKDIEWRTVDEDFLKEYGEEVEAELGSLIFVIHLGKVIDTDLA